MKQFGGLGRGQRWRHTERASAWLAHHTYPKEMNGSTATRRQPPSSQGLRGRFMWGILATDRLHMKPFVTEAAALKIEGRMFDKCDGPGMQLQPSGSLSKGNGSLLWTERWKLSKWVEWLTSSDRELDYNKWRLTWPETGKHPLKPRSAFHLGDTGREKGQERAGCPSLHCPSEC